MLEKTNRGDLAGHSKSVPLLVIVCVVAVGCGWVGFLKCIFFLISFSSEWTTLPQKYSANWHTNKMLKWELGVQQAAEQQQQNAGQHSVSVGVRPFSTLLLCAAHALWIKHRRGRFLPICRRWLIPQLHWDEEVWIEPVSLSLSVLSPMGVVSAGRCWR